MKTSYFSKYKGQNAVAICIKPPYWYKGRVYEKLNPPLWLLKHYHKNWDKKFYIENYYKEVLDKLNPQDVYNELGEDAVLLCWEKSGDFCHRRLVAEWLEWNLGIQVKEMEKL